MQFILREYSKIPCDGAASNPYTTRGGSNSWDESGPGEQPLLSELWLTDMGLSGAPTIRFSLCGSKLDVNHTAVGVGKALYLQGPITEIALYARPDLGKRFWKLVGVYPVSDGFARLDLKELEGKGQTGDEALYIVPGHWLKRLLGFGWPSTIEINREEVLF